jgi:hypothetical protein
MISARGAVFALVATFAATVAVHGSDRQPSPIKKALADGLIAETKSNGVFDADDTGKVTHLQSGMECFAALSKEPLQLIRLITYPSKAKGGDVSCGYMVRGETGVSQLTLYAYHHNGQTSEQLIEAAVQEIRAAHGDWTAAEKAPMTMAIGKDTATVARALAARFEFGSSPEMFSSIWVGTVGDWAIKMRATYPKTEETATELQSILLWAVANKNVREHAVQSEER